MDDKSVAKLHRRKVLLVSMVPVAVVLIVLLALGWWRYSSNKQQPSPTVSIQQPVNEISLAELLDLPADAQLKINNANQLVINGELKANQAFVVAPGNEPSNPQAGQLYFDVSTERFRYYDGSNFVSLAFETPGQEICYVGNDCGFLTPADLPDGLVLPQPLGVTDSPTFANITITNDVAVASGGTGRSSFTNNALLVGNGGGDLNVTNAPASGQILVANAAGVPTFVGMSGIVSINSAGVTQLSNTGVVPGTYGDASNYPVFTVDDDGRITSVLTEPSGGGGTVTALNTLVGALTIDGTADHIIVTDNSSDTITLSLPQAIAVTSSPSFAGLDLSADLSVNGSTTFGDTLADIISINGTLQGGTPLVFEGAAADGSELSLNIAALSADQTITLPDASGTVCLTSGNCLAAPENAQYLALALSADLSDERVLLGGDGLNLSDGGANGNAVLDINTDGITIDINGLDQLFVPTDGITSLQVQDLSLTGSDIADDSIALGTKTSGNYVATIGNGSGISGSSSSEGGTPTIALGNLTANWQQTGAFDIVLDNASSELQIRGSGGAFYAILDVGALSGNETFTLAAGSAGDICTTAGNCVGGGGAAPADASYVVLGLNANLSSERVLTPGTSLSISDGGAGGNYSINTIQDIRTTASPTFASPTFTGTLAVQGASVTIGGGAQLGQLILGDGSSNTATIALANFNGNHNLTIPNPGGADSFCLQNLANCAGTAQNLFETIDAPSGSDPQADSSTDTLVLADGSNIAISGDSGTDTITVAVVASPTFTDLSVNGNTILGSDNADVITVNGIIQGASPLVFEGSSADANETTFAITNPTGDRTITFPNASGEISVLGQSIESAEITDLTVATGDLADDAVTLGTKTSGNYVATVTNGSGISGSSSTEGGTPTIALGPLTANWQQTGAFDIVLDNAASELRIMESSGAAFYAAFDVGDLSNDTVVSIPDSVSPSDTFCLQTLSNCAGAGQNLFQTIATTNGTSPVADSTTDTLTLADGSGVTVTGNSATDTVTLSLGSLTANWQQTGAFDVVLDNASSELSILESSGGAFYGTLDVTDLSANRTYTLPDDSGELTVLGQTIEGSEITNDTVVLTTDTAGNYVATIAAGTGISGSSSIEGGTPTIGFDYSATLGGNPVLNAGEAIFGTTGLIFEGSSGGANGNETLLTVTDPTSDRTIVLPDASGEVSLLGQTIEGSEITNDTVVLTTDTAGNYVATITAGSGIQGSSSSEGGTPTIALGNLTANWQQTGAFDIVLDNAASELRIMESAGATFYATFDVGDLSNNTVVSVPSAVSGSDTFCLQTLNNCAAGAAQNLFQTIDVPGGTDPVADTTTDTLVLADGSGISITGNAGIDTVTIAATLGATVEGSEITNDTVVLTTDTAGNYVATLNTGMGLSGSSSSEGGTPTIAFDYSSTLGGNPALSAGEALFGTTGIIFEGSTANTSETLLAVTNPTSDRTITLPDASGEVSLLGQTIESSEIANGSIAEVDLDVTNSPSDNFVLTYDSGSSGFTWVDPATLGGGEWTDGGAFLRPSDSSGAEDVVIGGTSTGAADIWLQATGAAVFNEQGADADFRVESSNTANAFFVQGSDGFVGVGTNAPSTLLDMSVSVGNAALTIQADTDDNLETDNPYIRLMQDGGQVVGMAGLTGGANINPAGGAFSNALNNSFLIGTTTNFPVQLGANSLTAMTLLPTGLVGIRDNSPLLDLSITGEVLIDSSNATYDVWIQGGQTTTAGESRNLALLGQATNDDLILNYNSEYNCVSVGGTACSEALTVTGAGSFTGALTVGSTLTVSIGNIVMGDNAGASRFQSTSDGGYLLFVDTDNNAADTSAAFRVYSNDSCLCSGAISLTLSQAGNLRVGNGTAAAPGFSFNSDTNMGLYRGGTDILSVAAGGAQVAQFRNAGAGIFLKANYNDVGNVNVLRCAQGGAGTLCEVGWFSSSEKNKHNIVPLEQSPLWDIDLIDDIGTFSYTRNSTGKDEIGFVIERGLNVSPYLTTYNHDAPAEYAILAVTVNALQDARARLVDLEAAAKSGKKLIITNKVETKELVVKGSAAINANLTVKGDTIVADIYVNGHIISSGSTPAISSGDAAGSGATVDISGTDTAGTITITTGNGSGSGQIASVDFARAFVSNPTVVVTAGNAHAADVNVFRSASAGGFVLSATNTLADSKTYIFDYIVIE